MRLWPIPIANVEPPPSAFCTAVRSVSAKSLGEGAPPAGADKLPMELVISLPAPKIKDPFVL